MNAKHTPKLPIKIRNDDSLVGLCPHLVDADNMEIVVNGTAGNDEFREKVVRAVNAHDAFKELAELVLAPPDDFACDVRHADELNQNRQAKIKKLARAALTKERGE